MTRRPYRVDSILSRIQVYSTQYTVHSIQYTVYSIQYTVYSIQHTCMHAYMYAYVDLYGIE